MLEGSEAALLGGRYELGEVLGRGGMGQVWAGRDRRLDRDVAIKVLGGASTASADARRRFDAEARHAARLSHPNVVAVFDSGEDDGTAFIVMERLPGRSLADEFTHAPLDPRSVRRYGEQILDGLAAAHHAGILHRDMKPSNVLLTASGDVKVGDFGIATRLDGEPTTGLVLGTVAYMAPERLAGKAATPQSDLYSVGVILYEALTGRRPFTGTMPVELLQAITTQRPAPIEGVADAALVTVVGRALRSDPERRFVSAREMLAALEVPSTLGMGSVTTPTPTVTMPLPAAPVPPAPSPPEPSVPALPAPRQGTTRRHPSRAVLWLAVPLVLTLVVGAAFALLPARNNPQHAAEGRAPTTSTLTPTTARRVPASIEELAALLAANPALYGSGAATLHDRLIKVLLETGSGRARDAASLQHDISKWVSEDELDPTIGADASRLLAPIAATPTTGNTSTGNGNGNDKDQGNGKGRGKD